MPYSKPFKALLENDSIFFFNNIRLRHFSPSEAAGSLQYKLVKTLIPQSVSSSYRQTENGNGWLVNTNVIRTLTM